MTLWTVVLALALLLQAAGEKHARAHGPPVETGTNSAAAVETGDHDHETALALADAKAPREWVEEKTGAYLPLQLQFSDEAGQPLSLGQIVDKPVLLLPVYYYCAGSCSRNLANLAVALGRMKSQPGRDFRVVAFSINDRERSEDARRARKTFLKLAGGKIPEGEWRFLTGDREAIAALAAAIGYRFEQQADGTYIHPSALVAAARDGRIIRYVYGDFIPGDLDMAVLDAGRNTPSLSVKRLLDICFNRDPSAGRGVVLAVKVGVLAVFGAFAAAILLLYRKRGGGQRNRGDTE
ncbi:SCO family protein [Desulfoprunum benzoelyticum]|uniref:Protein SCO1/2 n=1 Tax=Desulfoprunum benzoelyticum TaxID=1506996 RepID=A0A840UVI2_9BACT|nr:SCO family protein [Desulfoprunum benzoelyticum]MBB5348846.1 protein SCO1/2 [Desulfoprunum benzoelyticum]MBM9530086.1 SCO family protein [Desulfoprunum benzoelyticum]